MKHSKTAARLLLGLLFTTFGLNFFFHFLPMPPSTDAMGAITGAIYGTGYMFQFIKLTEIICGLLLLSGFFVPLALVVLAPITVNIVLMHGMLDPAGIGPGILILVLHIFLGVKYLNYYRPMLAAKTK
jgi:putative oxidoreductase